MQGNGTAEIDDPDHQLVFARILAATRKAGDRLRQEAGKSDRPICALRCGYSLKLCVDVIDGEVSISGWSRNTLPGFVWDGTGFWSDVDEAISAIALAELLERQADLIAETAVLHLREVRSPAARLEQALSLLPRWTLVDQREFFAGFEITGGETDWSLRLLSDTTGPRDGHIWPLFDELDAYDWLCRRRDMMLEFESGRIDE